MRTVPGLCPGRRTPVSALTSVVAVAAMGVGLVVLPVAPAAARSGAPIVFHVSPTGSNSFWLVYNQAAPGTDVDGRSVGTIDNYNATRVHQKTVFRRTGLTPGIHTLKGVMKTGDYMIVDSFRIH
ncbi:hypothetical protein [Streptomyces sp. NPDC002346]